MIITIQPSNFLYHVFWDFYVCPPEWGGDFELVLVVGSLNFKFYIFQQFLHVIRGEIWPEPFSYKLRTNSNHFCCFVGMVVVIYFTGGFTARKIADFIDN